MVEVVVEEAEDVVVLEAVVEAADVVVSVDVVVVTVVVEAAEVVSAVVVE